MDCVKYYLPPPTPQTQYDKQANTFFFLSLAQSLNRTLYF